MVLGDKVISFLFVYKEGSGEKPGGPVQKPLSILSWLLLESFVHLGIAKTMSLFLMCLNSRGIGDTPVLGRGCKL